VRHNKLHKDYLDYFSRDCEDFILGELLRDVDGRCDKYLDYYTQNDDEVYGAYKWHKENTFTREWLKNMACYTKEPAFTSFTNNKMCVDYIYY